MMHHTRHTSLVGALLLALAGSVAIGAASRQHDQHAGGEHRHPAVATMKNPVAANATSIAAGKVLFARHCAECHGDAAKGDGMMADEMDPKPPNLTDADWKHGSSDGEIFTVVRNGVKGADMKAFSRKMTVHQTWDVVNFLRSLGPAKSH